MWRRFSLEGNYVWIDKLQEFMETYNSRHHRTIGMAPIHVTKENEQHLRDTVFKNKNTIVRKCKFKVGDYVRTTRKKVIVVNE